MDRTVSVVYRFAESLNEYVTDVTLIPGYTTEADIPHILAVAHSTMKVRYRPEQFTVVAVS